MEEKTTLVTQSCVLSDTWFLIIMFYSFNSLPLLTVCMLTIELYLYDDQIFEYLQLVPMPLKTKLSAFLKNTILKVRICHK